MVYCVSKRKGEEGADLAGAREAIGYEGRDVFPEGLPAEWEIKLTN